MIDPKFKSKQIFKTVADFRAAVNDENSAYVYARGAQPIIEEANRLIADIDKKETALAFASGVGAISAIFCSILKSGDHVIMNKGVYSWSKYLALNHLARWNIEVTWIDEKAANPVEQIKKAIRPKTKLLFLEIPTFFTFEMTDYREAVEFAKSQGIITALDNTYGGPSNYLYGSQFDLCVYSATKIIVGNGQDMGGFITCSHQMRKLLFKEGLMSIGATMSWRVAQEMIKGLYSFEERIESISNETKKFLQAITQISQIKSIHSPWIESGKFVERLDFRHVVGLLSVDVALESMESMERFCDSLKVFKMGVSYGSPDALAVPSCAFIRPGDEQRQIGFIRLSLGEHPAELLIEDINQALKKIN